MSNVSRDELQMRDFKHFQPIVKLAETTFALAQAVENSKNAMVNKRIRTNVRHLILAQYPLINGRLGRKSAVHALHNMIRCNW